MAGLRKKGSGGARPGAGKKPFAPTAEQRLIVERAAGFGLTLHQILTLIINPGTKQAISINTLLNNFRAELDRGHPKAIFNVANALYNNAVRENNVSAQIFYLKSQGKWRDRIDVTVRRPDEMTDEELDAAIIAAAVQNGSTAEDPALWPDLPAGESPTKH